MIWLTNNHIPLGQRFDIGMNFNEALAICLFQITGSGRMTPISFHNILEEGYSQVQLCHDVQFCTSGCHIQCTSKFAIMFSVSPVEGDLSMRVFWVH